MNTKDYNKIIETSHEIEAKAQALIAEFTKLELTPSTERQEIEAEYKTILFGKLLTVDKGSKMRFDLCRTDKAKTDLINQSINLDGWDITDDLMIKVQDFIDSKPYTWSSYGMTPERFLTEFSGSVEAAFSPMVRDVTGTELYKEFKQVEKAINSLISKIPYLSVHNSLMTELQKAFKSGEYGSLELELQEGYIMHLLDSETDLTRRIERQKEAEKQEAEEAKAREIAQAKLRNE